MDEVDEDTSVKQTQARLQLVSFKLVNWSCWKLAKSEYHFEISECLASVQRRSPFWAWAYPKLCMRVQYQQGFHWLGYMCRKPFNDIVFCKWTIYGSNVQWMEEETQLIDGAIRAEWIRVTKWNIGCSADNQDLQQGKVDESDYLPFWQTSHCSQITAGIRSNQQCVNAHARSFCAAEYAICHVQGHS